MGRGPNKLLMSCDDLSHIQLLKGVNCCLLVSLALMSLWQSFCKWPQREKMADHSNGRNFPQPSPFFFFFCILSLSHMTATQDGFPSHMNAFINVFLLDLLQLNRKMMNRLETLWPTDPHKGKRESRRRETESYGWREGGVVTGMEPPSISPPPPVR